jgi:hypothetical protein
VDSRHRRSVERSSKTIRLAAQGPWWPEVSDPLWGLGPVQCMKVLVDCQWLKRRCPYVKNRSRSAPALAMGICLFAILLSYKLN